MKVSIKFLSVLLIAAAGVWAGCERQDATSENASSAPVLVEGSPPLSGALSVSQPVDSVPAEVSSDQSRVSEAPKHASRIHVHHLHVRRRHPGPR